MRSRSAAGATGNLTATASVAAAHVVIAGAFKIRAAAGIGTLMRWNRNCIRSRHYYRLSNVDQKPADELQW